MASKVFPIRASQEERATWQAAADRAGLSFNAWARRTLNEQVALDRAVGEDVPAARPPVRPVSSARAALLSADLAGKFKPDPRR